MAPLVVADHLGEVGEIGCETFLNCMIESGRPMHKNDYRPFCQTGAVGCQGKSVNVDKKPNVANVDFHIAPSV